MNKKQNIQQLVKDLSDENEKLKEENKDLKFKLAYSEKNYEETLYTAKKMIAECNELISKYNEYIDELKKSKDKYESANKEIHALKEKYEKELKNIINKI